MLRIMYYTTTDAPYLSIFHALAALKERFPDSFHIDFFGKNSKRSLDEMEDALKRTDVVLMTLMGTFTGMEDFETFVEKIRSRGIPLHIQSSVMKNSSDLREKADSGEDFHQKMQEYMIAGGQKNYENLLLWLSNDLKGTDFEVDPADPTPSESIYYRGELFDSIEAFYEKYPKKHIQLGAPFYRSQYLSNNTGAIDALIEEGERQDVRVIGFFVYSVTATDIQTRDFFDAYRFLFVREGKSELDALINLAGFSLNTGGSKMEDESILRLKEIDLPIIKAFSSTGSLDSWQKSPQGLTQVDYSMNVVMPEFDGQVMGHLVSHKEHEVHAFESLPSHVPFLPGIQASVEMAKGYARLRKMKPGQRRVAIIFHNYPAGDANIGSASGLDTFASVHKLLVRMEEEGYTLERNYASGEELLEDVLRHGTNERHWVNRRSKGDACIYVKSEIVREAVERLELSQRDRLIHEWGEIPGEILCEEGDVLIPGFSNGNVFIGMQPARGFSDDPDKITHSPDLPPHYQYVAYYHFLKNIWQADAYIHVGTHGTLEFLPGKSTGLGPHCFPFQLLDHVPNFYLYIIKNPGEGTIAKRRTNASIVSYLIPRLSFVDDYETLEDLETKIRRYEQVRFEKIEQEDVYFREMLETVEEMKLHEDLDLTLKEDPEEIVSRLWKYLYEIRGNYITKGLHTLGELPEGEDFLEMLMVLLRVENGDIPSFPEVYAASQGLDYRQLSEQSQILADDGQRYGEKLLEIHRQLRVLLRQWQEVSWEEEACRKILSDRKLDTPAMLALLDGLLHRLFPALKACTGEIDSLMEGLEGRFILPGKSGNISRGGADLLPTGRNFYTLDPLTVPGKSAWKTGQALGDAMLQKYFLEKGEYPESVAIVLWGLSTIRSRGDDLAQIYYLLGLEPVWDPGTERVTDFRVIPIKELGRPRIDVTVRISGVFRDMFPHQLGMLEKAFSIVADLQEEGEENYLRSHVLEDMKEAIEAGVHKDRAKKEALFRVFGCKPGAYGAGISHAIDESSWQKPEDLADIYLNWGSHVYTSTHQGTFDRKSFERRLMRVEATMQNATSRETDILHVDDYYQYHGGLAAAVKHVRGEKPLMYCGDTSDPKNITIREADKELKYVYRSRVLNTDWIDSMKEHGYKAAGDLAKMFSYALGWDATAEIMDDWMYDALADHYLLDEDMREFLEQNNPLAMKDMIETLLEAHQRQLWETSEEMLSSLYDLLLQAEGYVENTLT